MPLAMNFRQLVLRKLYPLVMRFSKAGSRGIVLSNDPHTEPKVPFHSLKATQSNGQALDFSQFEHKKVLLVNTASSCGYTGQYEELQQLHQQLNDRVVILGFPANDFREQEKGDLCVPKD